MQVMKVFTNRNLLLLVAFLLIANLATWYWFIIGMHLIFSSEIFDHIVSPLSGILGFIAIAYAIFVSAHQNRIAQSQNLRPYFDREIDKIEERISKKVFKPGITSPSAREYTGFTYEKYLNDLIMECVRDLHFAEDHKTSEQKNSFTWEYLLTRTYGDKVLLIGEFTHGLGNRFEYDTLIDLIKEIKESKLIEDEQAQLIRRIKKEIIGDYLSMIRWFRNPIVPTIPIMNIETIPPTYIFTRLGNTSLADHYELFEKEVKEF